MKSVILTIGLFFCFNLIHSQTDYEKKSVLYKPSNPSIENNISKDSLSLVVFDSFTFNNKLHKELNNSELSIYTFGGLYNDTPNISTKYLFKPVSKYALEGLNEAVFYKRLLPVNSKMPFR